MNMKMNMALNKMTRDTAPAAIGAIGTAIVSAKMLEFAPEVLSSSAFGRLFVRTGAALLAVSVVSALDMHPSKVEKVALASMGAAIGLSINEIMEG